MPDIRTPDDERPDWRDDVDDWRRVEHPGSSPLEMVAFGLLGLFLAALLLALLTGLMTAQKGVCG